MDVEQLKEFYHKKGNKMSVKRGGRFTKNHFSLPKQTIDNSEKTNDMTPITIKNTLTEYPKIDQSILPEPLQANEFNFVNENIQFFGEDKDIDLYMNTFVEKLNLVLSKSRTKSTNEKVMKDNPESVKQKRKSKDKSKESQAYALLEDLFPDIEILKVFKGELYKKKEVKGFDVLSVESYGQKIPFGIIVDIGQYYVQNGDLMSAPRIQISVDVENRKVYPLNYEAHNTIPQTFQEYYDWSKAFILKDTRYFDTLNFMLLWFKNLKDQGFGGNIFEKQDIKEGKKKESRKEKIALVKKYRFVEDHPLLILDTDSKQWESAYDEFKSEIEEYGKAKKGEWELIDADVKDTRGKKKEAKTSKKSTFKPKFKPGQRAIWTSSKGTKHHGVIVSVDEANPGTYLFRGDDWNGDADNVNESGLRKEGKRPKKVKERKTEPKGVGHVDIQVSFIKSFVLMQGKTKTKEQILNLYRRIEKAAIELKIRKSSQYAEQITYIIHFLKDSYNDKKYNIEIPKGKFDGLYKIAYSEKQQSSVLFIKRYLGLFGKENIEDKAKALLDSIKMTIKSGKIQKEDIHFDKLESIQANLEGFLLKSKKLFPENFDLKGLVKFSDSKLSINKKSKQTIKKKSQKEPFKKGVIKSLKSKKVYPGHVEERVPAQIKKVFVNSTPETIYGIKLPPGVISSNKLKTMEFETIKLKGDWSKLIGEPTKPFHIMIYGTGGMGKSTQSIHFAKYMASEHGFNVLYVAKEEGIGNTIKEKFERLHAFDNNIFLVENEIPKDLSYFDLIVLDSVNELDMSPDSMRELQGRNPALSTLQIFKVRKDGVFLGESDFKHLCQAELVCEQGYCHSVKNRFGGNEWAKIKDFTFNDTQIKDLRKVKI
jgi:hypothetical protein